MAGHYTQPGGDAAGAPLVPLKDAHGVQDCSVARWLPLQSQAAKANFVLHRGGLKNCLCITQDTTPNPVDRLLAHRWYLSTTVMPDGRALITSGQDQDITGE